MPQLVGDILKQGLSGHPGVIHQQRHGAKGVLHPVYHVVDLLSAGHVGLRRHHPAARRRQLHRQCVGAVLPLPVVDADGIALRRQLSRHGAADAPGRAGNQCDPLHILTISLRVFADSITNFRPDSKKSVDNKRSLR